MYVCAWRKVKIQASRCAARCSEERIRGKPAGRVGPTTVEWGLERASRLTRTRGAAAWPRPSGPRWGTARPIGVTRSAARANGLAGRRGSRGFVVICQLFSRPARSLGVLACAHCHCIPCTSSCSKPASASSVPPGPLSAVHHPRAPAQTATAQPPPIEATPAGACPAASPLLSSSSHNGSSRQPSRITRRVRCAFLRGSPLSSALLVRELPPAGVV